MKNNESDDEPRETQCKEAGQAYINLQYRQLAKLTSVLFHIFHQVLDAKADGRDHLDELNAEVIVKACLVALSNTITNPWAVMIMCCNTLITTLTVLCP